MSLIDEKDLNEYLSTKIRALKKEAIRKMKETPSDSRDIYVGLCEARVRELIILGKVAQSWKRYRCGKTKVPFSYRPAKIMPKVIHTEEPTFPESPIKRELPRREIPRNLFKREDDGNKDRYVNGMQQASEETNID